jgi:hypothetical protein
MPNKLTGRELDSAKKILEDIQKTNKGKIERDIAKELNKLNREHVFKNNGKPLKEEKL